MHTNSESPVVSYSLFSDSLVNYKQCCKFLPLLARAFLSFPVVSFDWKMQVDYSEDGAGLAAVLLAFGRDSFLTVPIARSIGVALLLRFHDWLSLRAWHLSIHLLVVVICADLWSLLGLWTLHHVVPWLIDLVWFVSRLIKVPRHLAVVRACLLLNRLNFIGFSQFIIVLFQIIKRHRILHLNERNALIVVLSFTLGVVRWGKSIEVNLSVARNVEKIMWDTKGLPIRHLVLRILLSPGVMLLDRL